MRWLDALYVFIGGGLGSLCRYRIAIALSHLSHLRMPTGTLAANFVSCLILGIAYAYTIEKMNERVIPFLIMTGFCGGFSTFSTFTLENFRLFKDGMYLTFLLYVFLSVILCLGGLLAGIRLWSLFS